jgi:hypothetical protein
MKTDTPPSSPNLTGPCVMVISLALKAAIVAGIEATPSAVRIAWVLSGGVHQDVRRRGVAGIGIEDQVDLDAPGGCG